MKAKNSIKETLSAILIIAFVLQLLYFTSCSNESDLEIFTDKSSDGSVLEPCLYFDRVEGFAEAIKNDSFTSEQRRIMDKLLPKDAEGNVCLPAIEEVYVPIFPEDVHSCSYTWYGEGKIFNVGHMKKDFENWLEMYREQNPDKEYNVSDYYLDESSPYFEISTYPGYNDIEAEIFRDIDQQEVNIPHSYAFMTEVVSEEVLEDGTLFIKWNYSKDKNAMQTTISTIEKEGITYHIRKDYWVESDGTSNILSGEPSTTYPNEILVLGKSAELSFVFWFNTSGLTDYDNDLLTSIRYVTYPEYLNMKQTVTEDNAG